MAVHLSKLEALKINVLTTENGAYPFTSGQKMKMHPVPNRSIAVHFSVFCYLCAREFKFKSAIRHGRKDKGHEQD